MTRVVVLAEAAEDIEKARDFYDEQQPGIGDYCADSLVTDIESLALYHGIHSRQFGFYRLLATGFPLRFITAKPKKKRKLLRCWTCAAIPIGFARNFPGGTDLIGSLCRILLLD